MSNLPVLSLKRRNAELANAHFQHSILESDSEMLRFDAALETHGISPLAADGVEILQVNVGKMCNMTCRHCHVDAGPDRREIMVRETIDDCLNAIQQGGIKTVDLTGGAPEMNPDFKYFVKQARKLGCHVIDRCNLTILLANGYKDMANFLAENRVEVVASLPCYLAENADAQRGSGAYDKSVEALKILNDLGYGVPDSGLLLTLVFNPIGPTMPPDQPTLETAYRNYLLEHFGIHFNRLFTITNMPISRFLEDLLESKKYDEYMDQLIGSFNPTAATGVMCRKMLSVGWDGQLYDCDFNQMLELKTATGMPRHIRDFDCEILSNRAIMTGRHCFGCTASAGSGCSGAIDK